MCCLLVFPKPVAAALAPLRFSSRKIFSAIVLLLWAVGARFWNITFVVPSCIVISITRLFTSH